MRPEATSEATTSRCVIPPASSCHFRSRPARAMGQPWRRWVDCTDEAGRARQVLVTVAQTGQLQLGLPGGEAVLLHRYQSRQLQAAVGQGLDVQSRVGAGS